MFKKTFEDDATFRALMDAYKSSYGKVVALRKVFMIHIIDSNVAHIVDADYCEFDGLFIHLKKEDKIVATFRQCRVEKIFKTEI